MRGYVDATRKDEMLHRGVVQAVNGLVEYLQSERKRVPDEVLLEAERWNVCSSLAKIRTSKAMSLLVFRFGLSALRQSHHYYGWHEADLLFRPQARSRCQTALHVVGFTSMWMVARAHLDLC